MAAKEYVRLALYFVEWILSVVCVSLFPSSLYRTTKNLAQEKVCAIGSPSFCRFGIAWTLLAVLILSVVIIWHLEEYCTPFSLPIFVELCLLVLLVVWWLIAAATFMFTKTNQDILDVTAGTRRTVRVCSWVLVVLFMASAFNCWRIAKGEQEIDAFNLREQNLRATGYQHSDAGYREYA